jgi:hypothetical protein
MPWLLFSRQGKWLMAILMSWLLCSRQCKWLMAVLIPYQPLTLSGKQQPGH